MTSSAGWEEMWGRVPDLYPSGAHGQHNSPGLPLSGLSGCLGNSWGLFPPIHGRGWVGGGKLARKGGAGPLHWILYKEEECEQSGLGFAVPAVGSGAGTKMLRLGYAKPRSWASFWAILTLVGLATRAGEWAVGAGDGGARRRGRTFQA